MIISIATLIIDLAILFVIAFFTNTYTIWWADVLYVVSIPILYVLSFGILCVYLYFTSLIMKKMKPIKKPDKYAVFMVRQVCYMASMLCNMSVKVVNRELMPEGNCLMVTNHVSNFDPMVVMNKFMNKPIYCISKPENMRLPIGGPYLVRAGFIPIDRVNPRNAIRAIMQATKYITEGIGSIYVCPEGTRSKDYKLHEFHAGTFKVGMNAEAPIVIMVCKGTEKIHKQMFFRRSHVTIEILKVLYPKDYENMSSQEVSDYAHDLMEKALNQGE